MKKKTNNRRNSLAVRLNDKEHELFMKTTGRHYSDTLRELINVYADNYIPEDQKHKVSARIPTVLKRL